MGVSTKILPLVGSLPGDYSYSDAKMLSYGNKVLMIYDKKFFRLSCTVNVCQWEILEQRLGRDVRASVAMFLPEGYSCKEKTL